MKKIYFTLFAFMLMANAPAAFAGEESEMAPPMQEMQLKEEFMRGELVDAHDDRELMMDRMLLPREMQ